MTVEIDDILRVSCRLTFEGNEDDIVGVYHWGTSGASETDEQTLLNIGLLMDTIYTNVNARMSTEVKYEEINVKNVTQNTVLGDTPFPVLVAGTLVAEQLPPQIACLVVASTFSPSRQGRKYLGGFTETDNDSGRLGGALVTACANFGVDYVKTKVQGGITYRPLIMSSPDGPLQPVFPLLVAKVITAFRTQRRRTVGRGS